jgi:outer membrane protein
MVTITRRRQAVTVAVLAMMLSAGGGSAVAQTTLTLEAAIGRAQAETADARALVSAVDAANARVRGAHGAFWPRIDLFESVQRGNHPVFVFSSVLAQRRFSAANFAIAALNQPDPITNTRTAVVVDQMVFDGGLTKLDVQAARLNRDSAAAAGDTARLDLGFRAAQAVVRVLQLEASVRAMDGAVAAAESDQQRTRDRRDVGLVTEADALAVDVHLADMRQRQIAATGALTVARLELADLVGLPLTETIVAVRPSARPAPAAEEQSIRQALDRHPELRQADVRRQLADTSRRSALAALLPAVGVQAGWERNGETFAAQRASWVVGAEVRLNVFRGFADAARLAETRHAQLRAGAERDSTARRLDVAVRASIAQLAAARAREDVGRAALAQARESQRIIRDRYENGLASVTDLLRAAEATLNAESRATAAEMDVILQGVALERALGRL